MKRSKIVVRIFLGVLLRLFYHKPQDFGSREIERMKAASQNATPVNSTKLEFIKFYLADIFWYMNKPQNIFRINLFQCLYFLTLSLLVFCNTFLYPQFFLLAYQPSINCSLMPVLDNFLHIGYTFHNRID